MVFFLLLLSWEEGKLPSATAAKGKKVDVPALIHFPHFNFCLVIKLHFKGLFYVSLEGEGRLGLAGHSTHIQLILQMMLLSFKDFTKEIPPQLLIFHPFSQLSGEMRLNLSSDGAFSPVLQQALLKSHVLHTKAFSDHPGFTQAQSCCGCFGNVTLKDIKLIMH